MGLGVVHCIVNSPADSAGPSISGFDLSCLFFVFCFWHGQIFNLNYNYEQIQSISSNLMGRAGRKLSRRVLGQDTGPQIAPDNCAGSVWMMRDREALYIEALYECVCVCVCVVVWSTSSN